MKYAVIQEAAGETKQRLQAGQKCRARPIIRSSRNLKPPIRQGPFCRDLCLESQEHVMHVPRCRAYTERGQQREDCRLGKCGDQVRIWPCEVAPCLQPAREKGIHHRVHSCPGSCNKGGLQARQELCTNRHQLK